MQTTRNTWVMLLLAVVLVCGPIGCSKKEGIGERTGKSLDKAAAEIKDGAEEAGQAIKEGAEDAGDAIKKGAKEAEEAIEDATD